MTTSKFIEWLKEEIDDRNWSPAEFARQAKISPSQITRLFNGERGISEKSLQAFAHALKLPIDLVYEKAGYLPPKPELSPTKRKLAHLAEDLPDSDIEMVITLLEQRQEYYKKHPKARPAQ